MEFDVLSTLKVSFFSLAQSVIELTPIFIAAFIISYGTLFVARFSDKTRINTVVRSQLTFFAILGVLVAFITDASKDTVLENMLPSVIVAITFFFQLYGRTSSTGKAALRTKATFLAGFVAAFSFILSLRFFQILY